VLRVLRVPPCRHVVYAYRVAGVAKMDILLVFLHLANYQQ